MNKLKEFILNNKIFCKCSVQEQKEILDELERIEGLLENKTPKYEEVKWNILNKQSNGKKNWGGNDETDEVIEDD